MTASDHLDDADAWEEIGGELLADFESWADEFGVDVDHFVAQAAVDWRLAEGGHPGKWQVGDLRELLLVGFPRGVVMVREQWDGVPTTLHRWVDFLSSGGENVAVGEVGLLHSEIDENVAAFHDAMGDERNSGPAKFWVTRMREHGVDPDDPEENARFLTAVRAGEVHYDRDVLDVIARRSGGGVSSVFVKPAASTADEGAGDVVGALVGGLSPSAEVAVAAARSELITRLRVLVDWVGADGRSVVGEDVVAGNGAFGGGSEDGGGGGFSLLVEWGKAVQVVRVADGKLVLGDAAAWLAERPVEVWRRGMSEFQGLGHVVCPSQYPLPTLVGQFLPEIAPDLWACFYGRGGEPVPVAELGELLGQALSDQLTLDVDGGVPDGWGHALRRDVLRVAAVLEVLGVVEVLGNVDGVGAVEWSAGADWPGVTGSASVSEVDGASAATGVGGLDQGAAGISGEADEELGRVLVRATPLGLWGAGEVLRELGLVA
ncbi:MULTISPECIES: hypothetical protein [Actinosynnema]|uniref:hypothetical protein n=1 Tax=Actinosynnema TaxID=40566 RepID=UPI0020A329CE|nr:hypothetical protein [Actinosynnema pretiosum]MCP2099779.1 hypothetical protein [Actinosynnema pretiosum]